MIILYIVLGWSALSLICAPVLIPLLVRRFAMHKDWVTAPPSSREQSSVTPQIRTLRRAKT